MNCINTIIKKIKRLKTRILKQIQNNLIRSYITIVLVFAFINWITFLFNTTSFQLSEQMNKHVDRYAFLNPSFNTAKYHKDAKDKIPFTISELNSVVMSDLITLDSINYGLELNKAKQRIYSEKLDSLQEIIDEMRTDSINSYIEEVLYVHKQRIDSLEKEIEKHDSTKMILEGKFVELAKLKYEYEKQNLKARTHVLEYYGSFINDSILQLFGTLTNEIINEDLNEMALELSLRDVTTKLTEKTEEFHYNRRQTITFWDFLYYSFCVSTTVSFGDIAPNSGCTRFLAIFELLLCIIVLKVLVDKITEINKREKS